MAFLCEIWEKSENKNHKFQIEKMLEEDGLAYISTPRPRGWGGAAIIVNQQKFTLEKMNISIPHNLEIVWGLLKPKSETAKFKKIIVCSFYSPPNSRKNIKLTDHIISTLQMLNTKYKDCPMILGADKNSMNIGPILNCGLRLTQVVDLPTRQGVILDVIIMNTPQYYNSPIIIPPVPCDDPNEGKPSDHSVPLCIPHTDRSNPPLRRYRMVTYRPLPESCVRQFGAWVTSENFSQIKDDLSTDEHAMALGNLLIAKLDEFGPTKTTKISSRDKAWINAELKVLSRRKQREYLKKGKSDKYNKLAEQFDIKYKNAAQKYLRSKIDALKEVKPGEAFSILKTMGAQPGDCNDDLTFTLPTHQIRGLTDQQSADEIAEYFAAISREYPPLDLDLLPPRVINRLAGKVKPPLISEHECYERILKARKPKSSVPGDLPSELIKEFSVELAEPLCKLLNNIVQSQSWPQQWKTEFVTPIGKIPQPETEDDLRPIALTAFFSKVMEQFVVMWLLEVVGHKLDFRQYGGTKGNSTSHYLIELINFILMNQDSSEQVAVLASFVDFSKAFNRQDHSILITKLCDLGVPGWLLRLVTTFLENRKMIVRYKGKSSKVKDLPGCGPQGTLRPIPVHYPYE